MTPKTWRLFERVLSGSPCWSPQPCGCSLESGVYPPVIRSVMNWSMGISGSLYRLYIWPLNWCNFRKAQIKPIHSERSWGKGMSIANPVRWGPGYPVCFGPFWRCLARTRWRNDDFDFRSSWLTDASSKCGSPQVAKVQASAFQPPPKSRTWRVWPKKRWDKLSWHLSLQMDMSWLPRRRQQGNLWMLWGSKRGTTSQQFRNNQSYQRLQTPLHSGAVEVISS